MRRGSFSRAESGQAAVETAITLPLTIFLFFGTLQLVMMMQGRILAQYGLSRATRAASLNHGDCKAMKDVSLAVLLPALKPFMQPKVDKVESFIKTYTGKKGGVDWRSNRYHYERPAGGPRAVVWIDRVSPDADDVGPQLEEDFDISVSGNQQPPRLETRMVFWMPLKIPFANWMISHIALTQLGIEQYTGVDPLNPRLAEANWTLKPSSAALNAEVRAELVDRIANSQYAFPITVSSAMRMMSPPRRKFFKQQNCLPR